MREADYWKDKWRASRAAANNFAKRSYKLIKAKKLKTLLDLGCGDGRDSAYFAARGLRVTAIDFSESGIRNLKARNGVIDCVCRDIRNLNLRLNAFDIIYAHLSLHYFDDKTTDRIFTRLHRGLKKGGLFFVKCKSTDDALFGRGKKVGENMYEKNHVRHFFSKEYMAEKLEKFKIVRLRKSSAVYHEYKSAFIEAIATK